MLSITRNSVRKVDKQMTLPCNVADNQGHAGYVAPDNACTNASNHHYLRAHYI